jgi:hypothetical protein
VGGSSGKRSWSGRCTASGRVRGAIMRSMVPYETQVPLQYLCVSGSLSRATLEAHDGEISLEPMRTTEISESDSGLVLVNEVDSEREVEGRSDGDRPGHKLFML